MIRVLIPDMPSRFDVGPYLRRMDDTRVYVNDGPMVRELEDRLEAICGVPVVAVSTGTAALSLAMRALSQPSRAVMPALTFSATGLAARDASLGVCLTDVDPVSWQMPVGLAQSRQSMAGEVFVPVAAFGKPVPHDMWIGAGAPVVIDAAGALFAQECSKQQIVATCFSLHATKFVGAGEGGFVASASQDWLREVKELSRFGPHGTNAKLSEYHAAVALASLDRVRGKHARTKRVREMYRHNGIEEFRHYSHAYGTTLVVELPEEVPLLFNTMADRGIEVRYWYRPWLDERGDFTAPAELPNTDYLRKRLVGLPFHNFLTEADVAHVMASLREVIKCM